MIEFARLKLVSNKKRDRELDVPPVNRETRGFSCLTVLLSNCGAWLQDFIVTGHRGKRDFGSSLMLSKFRLNETGKPFRQWKHSLHVQPCLSFRIKPRCFGQPDTCSQQIGGYFWREGWWKSSPGVQHYANDMLWQNKLLFVSRVCGQKSSVKVRFVAVSSKVKQKLSEPSSGKRRVVWKRWLQCRAVPRVL